MSLREAGLLKKVGTAGESELETETLARISLSALRLGSWLQKIQISDIGLVLRQARSRKNLGYM
jgi:hypothetical protein